MQEIYVGVTYGSCQEHERYQEYDNGQEPEDAAGLMQMASRR